MCICVAIVYVTIYLRYFACFKVQVTGLQCLSTGPPLQPASWGASVAADGLGPVVPMPSAAAHSLISFLYQ